MHSNFSIRTWLADRPNRATLIALVAITVLAGVLRIAPLPQEPLWLDELHTSWTVVAGITDVASRARLGNQSPHYFYLPWLTTHVLGPSEFTLRLPSLAAGLSLVPLVFAAAVYFSGSRLAGLTAALLVALDQDCIFFAQEARPYAFVQVFAVINALCFWRMLTAPSFAIRAAWILTGALLFYTHYTAALILMAEGLFLVGFAFFVWLRGTCVSTRQGEAKIAQHKLLHVAFDGTILVILCLPVSPQLVDIFSRRGNWRQFIEVPDAVQLAASVSFTPLVGITTAVALAAVAVAKVRGVKSEVKADLWRPVYLGCWCLAPLFVVALCEWTNISPLFHIRYLIGALPGAILYSVTITSIIPSRQGQRLAYGMVVLAVLGFDARFEQVLENGALPNSRFQNWQAAIEYINQSGDRGVPVVVDSGLIESPYYANAADPLKHEYCVLPVRGIYWLSEEMKAIGAHERLPSGFYSTAHEFRDGDTIYWLITLRQPESTGSLDDADWGATQAEKEILHSDLSSGKHSTTREFGEVKVVRMMAGWF